MNKRDNTLFTISTFVYTIYITALLLFQPAYGISGDFNHGKYKSAYILKIEEIYCPEMCVLECARVQGCNGVNYDESHVYCELLFGTANDAIIDKPEFKFAAMEQWTIDNDVCYPNPCRFMQKCVITYNNRPVCVKIKERSDCKSIKKILRATRDGLYKVKIDRNEYFNCDMTTDKGGWTIFQQRINGSVDFYKGWLDYKNGFGDLDGEFWLGNEKLHQLTRSRNYELRIDLEKMDGTQAYAVYSTFRIGDEASSYKITVSGYFGTAGDSLALNTEMKFGTFDKDHLTGCPSITVGAWWYWACTYSNLNGEYLSGPTTSDYDIHRGVMWHSFSGFNYSLKKSKMMIRPKN